MNIQRKYKFEGGVWLTGLYNGKEIMGRTFTQSNINYVSIVTELAFITIVEFEKIKNLKKINFNKMKPTITCSLQSKKHLSITEKHLLETLKSLNN